jgi:hypothetical protein
MNTYLYCFKMENGMVKVGVTSELYQRINTLQKVFSPIINKESFLIAFEEFKNAYEVEQAIHTLLIYQRLEKISNYWKYNGDGSTEIYPTSSYEGIKRLFDSYATIHNKKVCNGLSRVLFEELGNKKHGKLLLYKLLNSNKVFQPVRAKREFDKKIVVDLSCNHYDFTLKTYQLDSIQDQMFIHYLLSFGTTHLKLSFSTVMEDLGYKDVAGFKKTIISRLEKFSEIEISGFDKKYKRKINFNLLDYSLNFKKSCQTHVMAVGEINITFSHYVNEIFNQSLMLRNHNDFIGLQKPTSGLLLNFLPKRSNIENKEISLNQLKGLTTLSKIKSSLIELKEKHLIANWKIENNKIHIGMIV